MALTLEAEQRMIDVGIVDFYAKNAAVWIETVRETRKFVLDNFPHDAPVRRDDVAKALIPIIEVHEEFKDFRNAKKLRQKFWIRYFADLLIDRNWEQLVTEDNDGK